MSLVDFLYNFGSNSKKLDPGQIDPKQIRRWKKRIELAGLLSLTLGWLTFIGRPLVGVIIGNFTLESIISTFLTMVFAVIFIDFGHRVVNAYDSKIKHILEIYTWVITATLAAAYGTHIQVSLGIAWLFLVVYIWFAESAARKWIQTEEYKIKMQKYHRTMLIQIVNIFLIVGLTSYLIIGFVGLSKATANTGNSQLRVSTSNASQPKEKWENFTSERDGFSVLLPSLPGYKATDYPIGDGATITEHKYVAQLGSVAYVINKYSFSDENAISEMASQPEGVLQYFLTQSVANQEGSKLLSSEFTYYGQYKAYDFLIDRSGIAKTQGRTILAGSAIYEILMG